MIENNSDVSKEGIDYDDDEDYFESVSCNDHIPVHLKHPMPPLPSNINMNKQELSVADSNLQIRIIPCKYAVRGTCHFGDKCLYLHDGK